MSNGKKWRVKDLAAAKRLRQAAKLRARNEPQDVQKNWKLMYTPSSKVARVKKLGFEYPKRTERDLLDGHLESDE